MRAGPQQGDSVSGIKQRSWDLQIEGKDGSDLQMRSRRPNQSRDLLKQRVLRNNFNGYNTASTVPACRGLRLLEYWKGLAKVDSL